ncbi:hypothetical protein ACFW7J_05525, partial [Streptomyces sp. NPDC059525]|uniref:hypothetical protein n=1 Tax=Streptomyces sp. NPDC059525 TaxID=3346857 RepID=UPI0036B5AA92
MVMRSVEISATGDTWCIKIPSELDIIQTRSALGAKTPVTLWGVKGIPVLSAEGDHKLVQTFTSDDREAKFVHESTDSGMTVI